MNKLKWYLLVVGLGGVVAVLFVLDSRGTRGVPREAEASSIPTAGAASETAPGQAARPPAPRSVPPVAPSRSATAEAIPPVSGAWARLAAKYGPEKTALSGKITSNLANVIEEGVDLANTAARGGGSGSLAEAASREAMRQLTNRLGLTLEQQQQASALIQTAVVQRVAAVTDLAGAMRAEPERLMETLLAGDALARQQIGQEEYDRLTLETRSMLQNVGGFVTGRPGAGGLAQMLGDEQMVAQFNALLTPDQQGVLAQMMAEANEQAQARQSRRRNNEMLFQNGNIPVMELERLDQSVVSIQQMAEAARMMMDAMKGLKDANALPTNP